MSSGIYVALAGARAQSQALDSTARNVANASTKGYKAERINFQESLTASQAQDQRYVNADSNFMDVSQGAIETTGNPLDVALDGKGYFAIGTAQGERYTRDGSFRLSGDSMLVNAMGQSVLDDEGEPISLPPDTGQVTVSSTGEISADGFAVANLKILDFKADQMVREGDNLFRADGPPVVDGERPEVVSEAVEGSNFNVVRGVVDIVKVTRTYQALLKMIEGYKETESRAATALGGPK